MFKKCLSNLICDGGEEKQEKEEKGEDLGSVTLEGKWSRPSRKRAKRPV